MSEDKQDYESLKRLLNWAIDSYACQRPPASDAEDVDRQEVRRIYASIFTPYPGGLPMQQAPTTTYLDELFDISTSAFDTARGAGRTEREAYRVAMGMVAARVKADIQAELRTDRWHTAATVLDLWAAARAVSLDTGDEA